MIWNAPPPRTNDEWQQFIAMCLGEGDTIQGIIARERAEAVEEATSGSHFARVRDLKAQLAELRALLAPLLDEPIIQRPAGMGSFTEECRFCGIERCNGDEEHAACCPVLDKDRLLGRA